MRIFAQTDRLVLREILPSDVEGMFALDADPQVHTYLGNLPVTHIDQSRDMITFIREQYKTHGIGRWAVIEKESGNFVGWAGLKFIPEEMNQHKDFFDVGYRLIRRYWGLGYATEAGKAALDYAFDELKLSVVYGMADQRNIASRQVLQKLGLSYQNTFHFRGQLTDWYFIHNPHQP